MLSMNTSQRTARQIKGAKYPKINSGFQRLIRCKPLICMEFRIPG